jgi:hypothetical protein
MVDTSVKFAAGVIVTSGKLPLVLFFDNGVKFSTDMVDTSVIFATRITKTRGGAP